MHVKGGGGTEFISINTYDVPVICLSVPGRGWPGGRGYTAPQVWRGDCAVGRPERAAVLLLLLRSGFSEWRPLRASPARTGHMLVTGTVVCLHWSFIVDLPPPGRQPGQMLIGSPLYCGCHCHHHSHWEGHTTSTPCVLRGGVGALGAIKPAMYTEHSREGPPCTRVQARWELGSGAQAGVGDVRWAGGCVHVRTLAEGLGGLRKHCWGCKQLGWVSTSGSSQVPPL